MAYNCHRLSCAVFDLLTGGVGGPGQLGMENEGAIMGWNVAQQTVKNTQTPKKFWMKSFPLQQKCRGLHLKICHFYIRWETHIYISFIYILAVLPSGLWLLALPSQVLVGQCHSNDNFTPHHVQLPALPYIRRWTFDVDHVTGNNHRKQAYCC